MPVSNTIVKAFMNNMYNCNTVGELRDKWREVNNFWPMFSPEDQEQLTDTKERMKETITRFERGLQ